MAKKDDFLQTARDRYRDETTAGQALRDLQVEDLEFKAGIQWPAEIKNAREQAGRPCLVVNHCRTHCNRIINDIRQNRPQIKVLPVDDQADVETAEVLNGAIRHIQVSGDADLAYDHAAGLAVDMGEGFWEVVINNTDVVDADGYYERELDIEPILNPHTVHLDPSYENPTGADAKWCFVDQLKTRKELEKEYPDKEIAAWDSSNSELTVDWQPDEEMINAARYYVKEDDNWTCYVITGAEILEEYDVEGDYLPIIRVGGEETVIKGKKDSKGLTRDIKDPCRMYNYTYSALQERQVLVPKAPYLIAEGAVEGYEKDWAKANTENIPYLPYKHIDEFGNLIPQPQRTPPVQADPGLIHALAQAHDDIKAVSGIFDASLGNRSNETSGVAQRERKQESNTVNFHWGDNVVRAIRQTGRVLVDLIPKVYAPNALIRILGEDNTPDFAQTSEQGPAFQKTQDVAGKIDRIYNLGVGKYDVTAKAGPSYSTQRQEAAEAQTNLLTHRPELMPLVGDLMIANMDWPGADDISKRLKTLLPPEIKALEEGEGDNETQMAVEQATNQIMDQVEPAMQQLQAQLQEAGQAAQQANQAAQKAMAENQQMQIQVAAKDLECQGLQQQLRDKSGELLLKDKEIDSKAKTEQMKVEGSIVEKSLDVSKQPEAEQPKESTADAWGSAQANTQATAATQEAVARLSDLAESLTQQVNEITASANEQSKVSAEVVELKEHIEKAETKKKKVEAAVLEFMQSDGSDKAVKKTVNAIKKS